MYKYEGAIAPYLHEITYSDYREDPDNHSAGSDECFGCSSARNGNFVGRNLDLTYTNNFEVLVHMKAKEGRYESIGVACHTGLREENMLDNKYDKELELLPNHTYDGINEKGVYCNVNVVPAEDTSKLTGTNPSAEKTVILPFIVRYILDNASSADDAIEKLKNINITGKIMEFSAHYMICDKDKTYIVEIIDNKLVAQEKTGDQQIMTNYYCNLDTITEHASGVERYSILKENYNEGATFDGMFNLLQRVKYSNIYKIENQYNYKSEFMYQSQLKRITNLEKYRDPFAEMCNEYQQMIKDNDRDLGRECGYWFTMHNSTYDIVNKKLQLVVQEDYEHPYEFCLD